MERLLCAKKKNRRVGLRPGMPPVPFLLSAASFLRQDSKGRCSLHPPRYLPLWARAESIDELISSYVAIAKLLWLPEQKAEEQEIIVQAIKIWLQTHQGWLLILDNADELALLSHFLPPDLGASASMRNGFRKRFFAKRE